MSREVFEFKSLIPVSSAEVFDWHKRPGAFDRLSPPWVDMQVLKRGEGIQDGNEVVLLISQGPLRIKWTLVHEDYKEGRQFSDRQIDGPFAYWHHIHLVTPETERSCYLHERVEYELPVGELGEMAGGGLIHRELERLFKYRHRTIIQDFETARLIALPPLKVLVSGSTGTVGTSLIAYLMTQGHSVTRLLRKGSQVPESDRLPRVVWDPYAPFLEAGEIDGFDVVVHLAGDNIAAERWTADKKKKILHSRLKPTQLLCHRLNQLQRPPAVFLCASAIGVYGDRGSESLTEESSLGRGFLADVCEQWEMASQAVPTDTRLVKMRFGVILTPKAGALQRMLLPFKMGAGGPIGSGKQFFSWIDIDDVVGAMLHCISSPYAQGAVNFVSPGVVTNAEFARTLGHVLERPAIMPMPEFAAKAMFGEMADECLLASQRVVPQNLLQTGYFFNNADLETSLRHVLGRLQ